MNSNDEKRINRYINTLKTIKLFLTKDKYAYEIGEELGISASCVKKYLNDPNIELLLGSDIANEIRKKLEKNETKGRQLGSENYVKNNEAIKLDNGEFCGSVPRI